MKPKNLRKKIRRLEARLQKGAKKLAKLKQKLAAATKGGTSKKSAARASKTRKSAQTSGRTEKKNRRLTPMQGRLTEVKRRPSATKKVKRKLNLTPERRAQLAAAMKARWAAKRATAQVSTNNPPSEPGAASAQISQP